MVAAHARLLDKGTIRRGRRGGGTDDPPCAPGGEPRDGGPGDPRPCDLLALRARPRSRGDRTVPLSLGTDRWRPEGRGHDRVLARAPRGDARRRRTCPEPLPTKPRDL